MKEALKRSVEILIAEDDDDDYLLTERAFKNLNLLNSITRFKNGKELIDYLETSPKNKSRIILLDLNMPVMDGRETLEKLKSNPKTCDIVVVVLTTSAEEEDLVSSYKHGANSYIRKPVKYADFLTMVSTLKQYWVEIVELP